MDSPDIERCAHLIHHAGDRGRTLPGGFCECPAGLIHAIDCPVSNGLECVHFKERDGAPKGLDERAYEQLHVRLMEAFVTRQYFHRIRSLCPLGDDWHRRKARLEELYAGTDDEEPLEDAEKVDAAYVAERDKLLEARRKRDAVREERKQQEMDRVAEQARLRVKTVVQRAQDTVAEKGNVATSYLDAIELPKTEGGGRRSKRRRGSRGRDGSGSDGERTKRGRRSGKPRGQQPDSTARNTQSGSPQPGDAPAARTGGSRPGGDGEKRGEQGEKKRPARRRRGRRGGRNRKKPE